MGSSIHKEIIGPICLGVVLVYWSCTLTYEYQIQMGTTKWKKHYSTNTSM